MSRFGGTGAKAALSVAEAMHAHILRVVPGGGSRPTMATVLVTGTGKQLGGVIYAKPMPQGGPDALKHTSCMITRVGGRWAVLA